MPRPDYETTMILVTRSDLNLSKGKLAAQCSHATAECILKAKRQSPTILEKYLKSGARKIVCSVSSLDSLKRIFGEAKEAGLICHMVTDAGHTEIPSGTVTVVGIGPGIRNSIDQITSSLPLLK
ncbi:MAG: peptidyl-tRNA hydrolase Pth2 [Candidatus Poseidoniales archaeon]